MRMTGLGAAACVLLLTVACSDNARRDRTDDTSGPAATVSRDTTGNDIDDRANTTADTVGTSGQAARTANASANDFAQQAAMANYAEIRLGDLAKDHAQNASVKDFAQMMVSDHTKALNELKTAAKGLDTPTKLDAKHQDLYDRLSKLKGAEFDREYMKAMVDGHRDVKNMLSDHADQARGSAASKTTGTTGAAGAPAEAPVNQWAAKTLPAVEQHLQKAEQIQSQLK